MAVYKYTSEGIDQLVRETASRSMVLLGLACLVGFAIVGGSQGISQLLEIAPFMIVLLSVPFFLQWRQRGRIRALVESVEFEIDGDAFVARSTQTCLAIRSDEVSELRYLRDGLLVRGRGLQQTLHVRSQIEGFEELKRSIEAWVPAEVTRKRSAVSPFAWTAGFAVSNLGLLFVAFTVTDPRLAVPVCIVTAVILAACCGYVWLSDALPRRIKWQMLACLAPIASLLGRAYLLWEQV